MSSMLDLTDIKVEALPSRRLELRVQTDQRWTSTTKCHEHMTEVAQAGGDLWFVSLSPISPTLLHSIFITLYS